jgi:hypothetical protein
VSVEIDASRPPVLRLLGAPRVNIVAALGFAGRTDRASAALVWDHRLFGQLYGSIDLGLGVSNGLIDPRSASDFRNRLLLGSSVLFREAPRIEWRFASNWAGEILGSHHFNRGINDAGLRLGYRFP